MFRLATRDDLTSIYRYLLRHLSDPFSEWSDADSLAYLGWYIDSSLCALVEDETIKAVVFGRPVRTVEDGKDHRYRADWEGSILWVECCATDVGMRGAWQGAMEFFASRNIHLSRVAWIRGRNRERVYQFPLKRVEALLR